MNDKSHIVEGKMSLFSSKGELLLTIPIKCYKGPSLNIKTPEKGTIISEPNMENSFNISIENNNFNNAELSMEVKPLNYDGQTVMDFYNNEVIISSEETKNIKLSYLPLKVCYYHIIFI